MPFVRFIAASTAFQASKELSGAADAEHEQLLIALRTVIGPFRLVALALAIHMLAALVIVHLPNGFFLPDGIEFVLALLAALATLALAGAGAYSVEEAVAARRVRT